MNDSATQLEKIWGDILSQQPELIQSAFDSLDLSSRKTVIAHLQRMVRDSGWQPEQQASAKAALEVLKPHKNQEK
jgi:hypothetical protein